MDPKERLSDHEEAFRTAVAGLLSSLWTALPCIVESVDFAKMTVSLQPTIQAKIRQEDGTILDVTLPLLVDVPICYPGGGGFTATFPIAQGDEAVAIFASRCIDSWWQSGGIQTQAELRMHSLSDAFCFIGPRSQPRVLPAVSSANIQLRKDDGSAYFELTPSGAVNVVAPGGMKFTTPTLEVTGAVTMDSTLLVKENVTFNDILSVLNDDNVTDGFTVGGNIRTSADVIAATVSLRHHLHSGVTTGVGNTGQPVP